MITRTHWLAALFLGGSLALAGCGNSAHVSAPSSAKNSSSSHGKTSGPMKRHCISSSYSIFTSLDPHWIMPNRVPSSSVNARRNWPIYNTQLAMNQFPASWHGNDLINTWKLPPRWVPYLSKNEKQASPFVNGHRNTSKTPLTLYITLQGTVFLYPQTIMQSQWPIPRTIGDIPPTTIVAEFVPLKSAVEAGIIPESSNQPISSGYVSSTWQKALGMTASQIDQAYK